MNKNIIVPVNPQFHNAVHQKAEADGLPVTDVVRGSLQLYLAGKIRIEKKCMVAVINEVESTGEAA